MISVNMVTVGQMATHRLLSSGTHLVFLSILSPTSSHSPTHSLIHSLTHLQGPEMEV